MQNLILRRPAILRFFEPLRERLPSKFAEGANTKRTQFFFCSQQFNMGIKNAKFDADFESELFPTVIKDEKQQIH
jgi:hypothetical protein